MEQLRGLRIRAQGNANGCGVIRLNVATGQPDWRELALEAQRRAALATTHHVAAYWGEIAATYWELSDYQGQTVP